MGDHMSWVASPVIRVGAPPCLPVEQGHDLPCIAPAVYAAMASAAPLTPKELAFILAGLHPCAPEAGDDVSQLQAMQRILVRLEGDVARGVLSCNPTLREGIEWAQRIGLSVAAGLAEPAGVTGVDERSRAVLHPQHVVTSEDARGKAHYDADLQAKADAIAAELKAAGKPTPKKVIADELKRRFQIPRLTPNAIMRRIRKTG